MGDCSEVVENVGVTTPVLDKERCWDRDTEWDRDGACDKVGYSELLTERLTLLEAVRDMVLVRE